MALTSTQMKVKVDKFTTNMDRFNNIVNGDEDTTVTTDNGPVPSVANFYSQQHDYIINWLNTETGDLIEQIEQNSDEAKLYRDQAKAFSEASGVIAPFLTKAEANAALSGLAANTIIEVFTDESRNGERTRYKKESGVYVFKFSFLDEFGTVLKNLNGGPFRITDARTTSVDSASDLNALFANTAISSQISPVAWPFDTNSAGGSRATIRVGSPVAIPAHKHLIGTGSLSLFRPLSSLSTSAVFRCNVDSSGVAIASLPIGYSSRFENVWFVNRDPAGSVYSSLGPVFQFAGQQSFKDIYVQEVTVAIEQASAGANYSDETLIQRVRSQGQLDTGVDGTRKALIRLLTNGDGAEVTQISNAQPTDATGGGRVMRGYTGLFIARTASEISRIVNGDIRISKCSSMLATQFHHEFGKFESLTSTGEYSLMEFYMRGDKTGGVDDPSVVTPFVISHSSDVVQDTGMHFAHDISFLYLGGWTNPYSTVMPNFAIEYAQAADIERFFRRYYIVDGSDSISCIMGVMQLQTASQIGNSDTAYLDFNNYSHIASVKSRWNHGFTKNSNANGRWHFRADFGNLVVANGISVVASLTTLANVANMKWAAATGNYRYRASVYFDKIRGIGKIGASEMGPVSMTNGAQAVVKLTIEGTVRGTQCIIRLYRGTTTNSYTHYVDIPMVSGGMLVDNGTDVCGFPWIARSAGAADAVNAVASTLTKFTLEPGNFGTGSDAYGNVEIFTDTNTLPTVGGFRKGDKILLREPVGERGIIHKGWERITDCDSSAATHGLYVDWMPISLESPHGSRTASQLGQAANSVNTKWKSDGLKVYNSDGGYWMNARGTSATAVWEGINPATLLKVTITPS